MSTPPTNRKRQEIPAIVKKELWIKKNNNACMTQSEIVEFVKENFGLDIERSTLVEHILDSFTHNSEVAILKFVIRHVFRVSEYWSFLVYPERQVNMSHSLQARITPSPGRTLNNNIYNMDDFICYSVYILIYVCMYSLVQISCWVFLLFSLLLVFLSNINHSFSYLLYLGWAKVYSNYDYFILQRLWMINW